MNAAFLLLNLLAACARPGNVPAVLPLDTKPAPLQLTTIAGPVRWEVEGLTFDIPAGWSGSGWPNGTPLRLGLLHAATHVEMEIWSFAATGAAPSPRPREGCVPIFRDQGNFRSGPNVPGTTVGSCVYDDPTGKLVEGWYMRVDGREIHVEALIPSGQAYSGGALIDEFLAGISLSFGQAP
jgi:hypothetical protein